MSEFESNGFVDYFHGITALDALLNPPKPVSKFVSPVDDIVHKPIDEIDEKLVGFLIGKKVCFTDEEIENYLIG